jgi:uncharacterized membrane protein
MTQQVPTDPIYNETYLTPTRAGESGRSTRSDRGRASSCGVASSIIAGVLLGSMVVCVVANFEDIRRYVRISLM